jgi:hypothetical protein
MLPACWENSRLEKSVVQIYTKNSHQKWLVKMVIHQNWLIHQKKFHLGTGASMFNELIPILYHRIKKKTLVLIKNPR